MLGYTTLVLAAVAAYAAAGPAPVALTGSDWLGVDGNWSSIAFRVGQPAKTLNLLVSTALSEIWVIGPGGCATNDPTCTNARGGVFDPDSSSHWSAIGTWQLPLEYPGYEANGEYGKDKMSAHSSITNNEFPLDNVLVSAINTTDFFNGFFGLGISEGNFSHHVEEPPLVQAVKEFGRIPSYTYGYTAGASYLNQPASLTLGGYDGSRFVNHSTTFVLSQGDDQPHALVRGISLAANNSDDAPDFWESQELSASSWNDSFIALIDSTTPYLWLPEAACERLADNLNLTYDDTFDLYTLSNDKYREYSEDESLSLIFSFSSMDNSDNFGDPLDASGVVNISIPLRAFVGTLEYPFMGGASIEYGDPAVPYFTLRKAPNDSTYVIGRSFLQEAYIITQYDQRQFSLHQARFPKEPVRGAKIQSVIQNGNSPYPGPSSSGGRKGLSTGAIVGIVIGSVSALVLALAAVWFCYRRRQKSRSPSPASSVEEVKDANAAAADEAPASPMAKLWRRLRGKPQKEPVVSEETPEQAPAEVADCQIYELPAPVPPVELNGEDDSELTGDTHMGLDGDGNLSAYEQARRKLNRQLQGPVPAYSPPENGALPPPEKVMHDLPPPQTVRSSEPMAPISPATGGTNSNSLPNSLPSPVSPKTDSNGGSNGLVSPLGHEAPPFPPFSANGSNNSAPVSPLDSSSQGRSNGQVSNSYSNSGSDSPISPASVHLPHQSATIQRTPIDPSKIVFLGNLPEHVTFPRRTSLPRINLDGLNASSSGEHQGTQRSSTLGSNYTEEQERENARRNGAAGNAASAQHSRPDAADSHSDPSTPHSQERIDAGAELVHVPQLAERRYSWEDSL